MMNSDCSVDIIGPYPPPYGGISIHISRILPLLGESGICARVYNQYDYENSASRVVATNKSLLWWVLYLFKPKSLVVHIHQFAWFQFLYVFLLSRTSKSSIFFTIHNEKLLEANVFVRLLVFKILKYSLIDRLIVVSKSLSEEMQLAEIDSIEWLPAYVPPKNNPQKTLIGGYNKKVAFNIWRLKNNHDVDVYGVDHLAMLAKNHPEIGFYLFVGDVESTDFAVNYINEMNIANCLVICGENLVDYLEDADLFLRLNRSDAYGISVQEALDLDVPAVASDICERAPGAILYKTGDFNALSKVFNASIFEHETASLLLGRVKHTYHLKLISLYKKYSNLKSNV